MKKYFALMLALMLVFAIPAFAASKAASDKGFIGNDQWFVQNDGDIVPSGTSDIGASADPVDVGYFSSLSAPAINYGTSATTVWNTFVVTLDPALTAYATGTMITFLADTKNYGACTFNVNGLGAKSAKAFHDGTPPDSYIESGSIVTAVYDGTNFQITSPDANP